jgi:hypothetical protein
MKNKENIMKKTLLALCAAGLLMAAPSCKKGENDPTLSLKSRKSRLTAEWTVASYVETSTSTQTYMDDPNNAGDMLSSTSVQSSNFEGTEQSYTNTNSSTYDGQGFGGITASSSEAAAAGALITTSYTSTGTNGSVTTSNTGVYGSTGAMDITFDKDGTFIMTRTMLSTITYTDDTDPDFGEVDSSTESETSTITGTWSFIAKNKADEFKDKERIALWYKNMDGVDVSSTDVVYTDKNSTDFYDYTQDSYSSSSTSASVYVDEETAPSEVWELDMLKSKEVTAIRDYSYTYTGTSSSTFTQGGITTSATGNPSTYTSSGTTTMTLTRE